MKRTFCNFVFLLVVASLFCCGQVFAQFTTPTLNGTIGTSEYGVHTNGQNQESNGSQVWFMTWDNTNLYIAISNANTIEAAVMYLDKDPLAPINGGASSNGTNVGFNYDGTSFSLLQFRADLVVYCKDSYREYRTSDGSNGWSGPTSGFSSYASNASTIREIAVPWSAIGGRPTSFAWFGYITENTGYVYGTVPTNNLGTFIGTSARYEFYYIVNSTETGTSTKPFSRTSYVFNQTSDIAAFGAIGVYDFTMNTSGRTITRSSGLWSINGNLRLDAGTIAFGSTSDDANVSGSLILGTGAILTLSATSGADLSVNGNISMSNTNILLNESNIALGGSVSGAGATNCLVTNSSGTVSRPIGASGSFTFPIGPGTTAFNPLTISLNAGDPTETFSVRVQPNISPSAPNNQQCVQRTWYITEATTGGNHAQLKFQWRASEQGTSLTNPLLTSAFRYDAGISQYVEISALTVTGSDPYVGATFSIIPITQFSPWVVGTNGGLPIQLGSFTGTFQNNNVRLNWTTISEVNNYGFYVQKRRNEEIEWTEIANSFIAGHGTTNVPQHYTFTDNSVSGGAWRYRLKQVDLDGSTHFTEPILIDVLTGVEETAPAQFALFQNYPNPFNPSTEIKFSVENTARATLAVYNVLGQKVAALFDDVAQAGQFYHVRLNAGDLASGMYFYKLESGRKSELKKMILMK